MVTAAQKISRDKNGSRRIAFYLFSMMAAIYLLTASGTIISDVGQLRIEVAKSITEKFDFAIPPGKGITGADGRDYSMFSLGSVLIALPFYEAGKLAGAFQTNAVGIMNQLVGAATVLLVYLFLHALGYARRTSIAVSLIYGLATYAWYYAKGDFDHTAETFFILLSAYSMYRYLSTKRIPFLLQSGAALGIATLTRPTSVLVVPPLLLMVGLFYVKKERSKTALQQIVLDSLLLMLASLPFLGIACWYNYSRFGTPFETGYTLMAGRLGLDFFSGTPFLKGLAGLLVSPGKGFFFYSPAAILFFFSIRPFARKHPCVAASYILLIVAYLFFFAKNIYWHGDWAWGPRYMVLLTPYLIIPSAALFESAAWQSNAQIRTGAYLLIGISFVVQLLAVSVNHHKYFIYLQTDKGTRFTVAHGKGVQPIVEPPESTYFNWTLSPILAQASFVHEIAGNLKSYGCKEAPDNATYYKSAKAIPAMDVFDFWWLYKYCEDAEKTGFAVAGALFLWIFYCALMLRKSVYLLDS